MGWDYYGFRPYVPVAQRRANATAYAARLAKKEKRTLAPVAVAGRAIAASFWGKAWCDNLESYSDYANRLPRGRTYVRNGSVIDLQVKPGQVSAIVSGSEIYYVTIAIKTLPASLWTQVKKDCARSIGSLLDLLRGRFDASVMARLTQRPGGLFPQPKEISMSCTCPDGAMMCKHVAAVLYGVGARLDAAPEILFTLRKVDHTELISQAVAVDNLNQAVTGKPGAALAGSDLGEIFGIEIGDDGGADEQADVPAPVRRGSRKRQPTASPKPAAASAAKAKAGRSASRNKPARRKAAVES